MNETYIKRIKNKLKRAMDSGMLNIEQQIAAIDDTLEKLLLTNNEDTNKTIQEFDAEIEKHEKQINDTQAKIWDDYKSIYDSLMKDL